MNLAKSQQSSIFGNSEKTFIILITCGIMSSNIFIEVIIGWKKLKSELLDMEI